MDAINFKNVWEKYRVKFIREKKVVWEEFWALKDISFNVERGQVVGIIGENGSGKTTVLKLIAGMLKPNRGEIEVEGKVSTLMELGAGFDQEVTGKENIILNSGLYGLSKAEIEKKLEDIIEFSGIGKFIDAPIKYYSEGMKMRLAFSLAIHVDPDILLIDDILAVGDELAKRKCLRKIQRLKRMNKTILIVSHDLHMLPSLCEKIILLQKGRMIREGLPRNIIGEYLETFESEKKNKYISNKGKKLIFDNGKIDLKFNNFIITRGLGFFTSFCMDRLFYNSQVAKWKIVDINKNNYLILKGSYDKLPLEQVFKFNIDKKGNIFWEVVFIPKDNIEVEELDINLMLSHEYTSWFSPKERRSFPPISYEDKDWTELINEDYTWSYLGVISEDLPPVIIKFDEVSEEKFTKVYNGKYLMKSRCLQLKHIFIKGFKKGEVKRFSGKIMLEKKSLEGYLPGEYEADDRKERIHKKDSVESGQGLLLKKGNLCLKCSEQSKFNIFWKYINLTKKLGIYTSINSNSQWFDSNYAKWRYKELNGDKFIGELIWPKLLVAQKWEICLFSNTIKLEIKMEVFRKVKLIKQQVNLMISELYNKSFINDGKLTRKFPKDFKLGKDGEWFRILSGTTNKGIGVEEVKKSDSVWLPRIKFCGSFLKSEYLANVVNSDEFHRARVLQYTIDDEKKITSGKYDSYFSGKIVVKE